MYMIDSKTVVGNQSSADSGFGQAVRCNVRSNAISGRAARQADEKSRQALRCRRSAVARETAGRWGTPLRRYRQTLRAARNPAPPATARAALLADERHQPSKFPRPRVFLIARRAAAEGGRSCADRCRWACCSSAGRSMRLAPVALHLGSMLAFVISTNFIKS